MKINIRYLFITLILLTIEIIIALFINDTIIRPYIGDILVVIVIYSFIKTFVQKQIKHLPLYIFLFATIVEISQYFNLARRLNLQDNKFIAIVIGSTFDIKDIICYLVGSIILTMIGKFKTHIKN